MTIRTMQKRLQEKQIELEAKEKELLFFVNEYEVHEEIIDALNALLAATKKALKDAERLLRSKNDIDAAKSALSKAKKVQSDVLKGGYNE